MENDLEIESLLESYISQPVYILSGSGFGWYYSEAKRSMVRVSRGSECTFCEEDPKNPNVYFVQIGSEIFSIPKEDLLEIGWN